MAVFIAENEMALLSSRKNPTIKDFKKEKDYIVYEIEITIGLYRWTVDRRYKDFLEFDTNRFTHLKHSFLPPKRLIGNQDIEFVKKRRNELQQYLQTVFELECVMQQRRDVKFMPRLFARFLDFQKYEIRGICDALAETIVTSANKFNDESSSSDFFTFSPLTLHAITERIKLAEPTSDPDDPKYDIGHVLDLCHRLYNLKIKGSRSCFGTSNIIPNNLEFSVGMFKNINALWISDCDPHLISDLASCRHSVSRLTVHRSLASISELILDKNSIVPGDDHRQMLEDQSQKWPAIKSVDFSFNKISAIDKSIIYLRPVQHLNLTSNRLIDIDHLNHLNQLNELDLSHNSIELISNWHQKLGNLSRLILTANKIRAVEGLSRLYSLEYLDLRNNQIVLTTDVRPLGHLPVIREVFLTGNPLEASVEYRSRVLEAFGDRASEVILDGEKTSQRELDTVGVRLAIRKAKMDRQERLRQAQDQYRRALDPSPPFNEQRRKILPSAEGHSESLSDD